MLIACTCRWVVVAFEGVAPTYLREQEDPACGFPHREN